MKKRMNIKSIILNSTFESAKLGKNNILNNQNGQNVDYNEISGILKQLAKDYRKQNVIGRNIFQVQNQANNNVVLQNKNYLNKAANYCKFQQIGTKTINEQHNGMIRGSLKVSPNCNAQAKIQRLLQQQKSETVFRGQKQCQNSSEQSQEDMIDLWNQIKAENKLNKQTVNQLYGQDKNISEKQSQESIELNQEELAFCFGITQNNKKSNQDACHINRRQEILEKQCQGCRKTEIVKQCSNHNKLQSQNPKQQKDSQTDFQQMWRAIQEQKAIQQKKAYTQGNSFKIIKFQQIQQEEDPQETKESEQSNKNVQADEQQDKQNDENQICESLVVKPLSNLQMVILSQILTTQSLNEQNLLYSIHYKQFNRRKFVTSKFNEGGSSYFAMRVTNQQFTSFSLYSIEMGNTILQCYFQKARYYFVLPKTAQKIGILYHANNKKISNSGQQFYEQNYELRIHDCYEEGYLPLEAQINVFYGFIGQYCFCDTNIIPIGAANRFKKRSEMQSNKLSMVINKKKGKLTTYLPIQGVKNSPFNCSLQLEEGIAAFMIGMMNEERTKFLIKVSYPISILIGMATAVARISYINKFRI